MLSLCFCASWCLLPQSFVIALGVQLTFSILQVSKVAIRRLRIFPMTIRSKTSMQNGAWLMCMLNSMLNMIRIMPTLQNETRSSFPACSHHFSVFRIQKSAPVRWSFQAAWFSPIILISVVQSVKWLHQLHSQGSIKLIILGLGLGLKICL